MDKHIGFTLAEVLITLAILGVIAALIIPNMYSKYKERILVSQTKTTYSILNSAVDMATTINGPVSSWNIGKQDSSEGAKNVYDILSQYLIVDKYYGKNFGGFDSGANYKTLSGDTPWFKNNFKNNSIYIFFTMKNGSAVALWSAGTDNCKIGDSGCIAILFDVNGRKGPNKVGIDTFETYIMSGASGQNGYLRYKSGAGCDKSSHNNQNGKGCLYWILQKGNMDYLRRDISKDW